VRPTEIASRLLEPVLRRIASLAARAVVTRVNDALKMQGLQLTVRTGETLNDVERFQQYGLTSVPEAAAEAIVLCLGGNVEHAVAIAVDDRRYRPKNLAAGEVQLYSKHGQRVLLKQDGSLELVAGSSSATLTAAGAFTCAGATSVKLQVGTNSVEVSSAKVTITSPGGVTEFL
jgi:phage baseplate assembly protein V